MSSISKPVELETLEKEIRTINIELEAKKAEKDTPKEKIKELEKKLASKQEEARTLESAWRKEKDLIDELKSIREQIDSLKVEADNYEREGNF